MDDGSQLLKALNVLMLKILVISFSRCFLLAGFLGIFFNEFKLFVLLYRIMQIVLHPLWY